jgi:hypothetical protein
MSGFQTLEALDDLSPQELEVSVAFSGSVLATQNGTKNRP